MSHQVFISYASQNRPFADKTYETLKQAGLSCWMAPYDIQPAESWIKSIIQGIRSCDVLVLLLCTHANNSKHVITEVERAFHYNKKILTVRLDDLVPCEDLEYLLARHHWLEGYERKTNIVLAKMAETLATLIGQAKSSVKPPPEEDPLDVMPLNDLVAEGIELVIEETGLLAGLDHPVSPSDVGRVLDTAIHYGAPAYNRGSISGCAEIYWATCQSLLEAVDLSATNPQASWRVPFLRFFTELEDVQHSYPLVETATANEIAWALRHTFDRFHTARGIQEIENLTAQILSTKLPLMRELIEWVLLVAIQHGNRVFDAKDLHGCAELHHLTARRLLPILEDPNGKSALKADPHLLAFHRDLVDLLDANPRVDTANSQQLAWDLYNAFVRLLKAPKP